jgi:hypothetical protein
VTPPKLLWGLSHDLASGTVLVQLRGQRLSPAVIELYRGWVHAIDVFPIEPALFGSGPRTPLRGEEALRRVLKLEEADWRFDAKLPPLKRGSCAPFHPAAVIRNVVPVDTTRMRGLPPEAVLQLTQTPHTSCIGIDERALVSFLARAHSVAEIVAARPCPFERAVTLLSFLEQMGTLSVSTALSRDAAYQLLELAEGATAGEVKKAYWRLARTLHPDAHPRASADERRDLERRFAAVVSAYRRLTTLV